MEDRLQKTIRRYQTALEVNLELERQVSGQPASIATISDQMMHLWQLDGKERYFAVLELLMHAIDAQSCALYLRRNGLMQLCASRSIDESAHLIILNLDDPLIRRVILHHQVSTVRDSLCSSESVSQKTALMAGPLFDRSKRVVGIVVLDSMPLLKFTPSAVRLFSSLLQMASISLQTEGSGSDTERLRSLDWNDLDSERSKLTVPVLQTSQGVFPE